LANRHAARRRSKPGSCKRTCAFDLLDAKDVREIEPGEMVRIPTPASRPEFRATKPHKQCIFEKCLFRASDSTIFGPHVNSSAKLLGPTYRQGISRAADLVCPFQIPAF